MIKPKQFKQFKSPMSYSDICLFYNREKGCNDCELNRLDKDGRRICGLHIPRPATILVKEDKYKSKAEKIKNWNWMTEERKYTSMKKKRK